MTCGRVNLSHEPEADIESTAAPSSSHFARHPSRHARSGGDGGERMTAVPPYLVSWWLGDAVVHHCQTVHRAEENTAPVRRCLLSLSFRCPFAAFTAFSLSFRCLSLLLRHVHRSGRGCAAVRWVWCTWVFPPKWTRPAMCTT